ncbi:hypothetical protein Hanom_Chr03g00216941 [Helianthus anomalus]
MIILTCRATPALNKEFLDFYMVAARDLEGSHPSRDATGLMDDFNSLLIRVTYKNSRNLIQNPNYDWKAT